jgi:hypothetical protein
MLSVSNGLSEEGHSHLAENTSETDYQLGAMTIFQDGGTGCSTRDGLSYAIYPSVDRCMSIPHVMNGGWFERRRAASWKPGQVGLKRVKAAN